MKLKALKRLNIYHLAVFFICLFHLGMNLLWLSKNTAPLPWDQAGHTLISIGYSEQFKNLESFNLQTFLHTSAYYPPLWHISAGILTLFTGTPLLSGPIICTVLFLACILLIFKTSYRLWRSDLAGLVACSIFSFLPPIYDHSRWFMLEIPLIFLITLTFYFLWFTKVDGLKKTLFFSILLACGLLTKWTYPIYLAVPIIYALYSQAQNRKWIVVGVISGLILASPWYLANLSSIVGISRVSITAEADDPQNMFSIANLSRNVTFLFNQIFTWPGFVSLVVGSYLLIKAKSAHAKAIVFTCISIVLFFTFIPNKNMRYILPISIYGSLLISAGLFYVNKHLKLLRIGIAALFAVYLLMYFPLLSFGAPSSPAEINYRRSFRVPLVGFIDLINLDATDSSFYAEKFSNSDWKHIEIIEALERGTQGNFASVAVLVDKKHLNRENLTLSLKTFQGGDSELFFLRPPQFSKNLGTIDYVLTTDDLGPVAAIRDIALFRELKDQLTNNDSAHLLKVLKLPDNDQVYIYQIEKQN